jgi:hypothetical protein
MQSAPSHDPETLQFGHPNVEIMILPHNTTLAQQSMDQGVIKAFKVFYTQNVYWHRMQAMDSGAFDNLKQYR